MSHQPNNVFAGTQVVSLVEVRGTNNSLVHPRGAVGVVTRTPTSGQNQFLVRFPDGFEASLTRAQLDVLKHFKDRLQAWCYRAEACESGLWNVRANCADRICISRGMDVGFDGQ